MSQALSFSEECRENAARMAKDPEIRQKTLDWISAQAHHRYTYNFTWLGRPIIQFPQDILAVQELIWRIKPEIIIETGIAHGGSLIFYASMLELIGGDGRVLGIDIDIREHNRAEIEKHPMFKRITMLEGSSIVSTTIEKVRAVARGSRSVMVILDSNHTHDHVAQQLLLYSPLVPEDSYLVVFDTIIEDMPEDFFPDRPWGKGNNPKTATREFLKTTDRFVIDEEYDNKLLITVAPEGYLRCVRD